jgi:hypothetical protein
LRGKRCRLACALVVPERSAAEQQEQHQNRKLSGGDALLTAVAVIPSEDEGDGKSDQECEESDLTKLDWPLKCIADIFQALQESPRSGGIDKSPPDTPQSSRKRHCAGKMRRKRRRYFAAANAGRGGLACSWFGNKVRRRATSSNCASQSKNLDIGTGVEAKLRA